MPTVATKKPAKKPAKRAATKSLPRKLTTIEPIEYAPKGSIKLTARDFALMALAGPECGPDDV